MESRIMDAKTAAASLRKLADEVEKTERLQGVAVILPPDPGQPIEIILAGGNIQGSFAQYVMGQIQESASPANRMFQGR